VELARGPSCGSGSDSFPTRIMYGMIHRMYAYVRTNGYVGTVFTRLVVERVNERDPCVNGQDMHVYVWRHALSRVNAVRVEVYARYAMVPTYHREIMHSLCKACCGTYVPLDDLRLATS